MSITDQPNDDPTAHEVHVASASDDPIPNVAHLVWPIVLALREFGGPASVPAIEEYVANALGLTEQQRSARVPSGQSTKFRTRLRWAAFELKRIGILDYPKRNHRELTELGLRIDEAQVKQLQMESETGEQSSGIERPPEQLPADPPTAWLIRAGRSGDRYDYNIENGLAALGWDQVQDLRGFSSRHELQADLRSHFPDARAGTISNYASQLWRLRTELRVGDLVVMPSKGEPSLALGTVTREYWYDGDPDIGWGHHVVSVDWARTGVPRSALGQDLLRSLGAQMTICSITRNDAAWRIRQLLTTGLDPGARAESDKEPPDLSTLVERFRAHSGYPTKAHEEQERLRAEWAEKLTPGNIPELSRPEFYRIASHATRGNYRYISTGDSNINRWITEMSEQRYTNMLRLLEYLCWGDDDVAHRIEEISNELYGTIPSKCLAICHPGRFLPIGVLDGNPGMLQMLECLGLPAPSSETYGEWFVEANDRLRAHVAPHLNDNPLAIAAFLYWLMKQDETPSRKPATRPDLDGLADELLVEVEFLEDIVELLQDKGQVILYGPPGTGKTYLARELAQELAPDESCRALVQFHPSTSYEDFFEGYRPAGTGDDGGIGYMLTDGPLRRIADLASAASDQRHVMIIDEINRGNLPRVLGELLFLLEYRDESVQTLYRPEEPFSLPKNLWFIGTMNTADRSIALVDAALRRRFHFVPFFPDSGPMAGLLDRWLEREDEPAWVGALVDGVNNELKDVLEGSHLLLGPSHFMKAYGSSRDTQRERLRRIWEYNIEPFIEDQFFGDPGQIDHFRFDAVMRRNGPATESGVDASDDDGDLDGADGSEGEHAAADGAAADEGGPAQPEDE